MTIISISINDKLLKDLEKIKEDAGYSGRSEIIRAGLRMLVAEAKEKNRLAGKIQSVLLLVHDKKSEDKITKIKHGFDDIVSTHLHNCLKDERCLEIFLLEGDAERIQKFFKLSNTNKNISYAKLLTP